MADDDPGAPNGHDAGPPPRTAADPHSTASPSRRVWWLVTGLLIAAFLARTPLYLSVLPPFEAWDEYQHLGYIAHLDVTGRMPVYDDRVPLAIRPLVVAMPHSEWGGESVREWGAVSYSEYWTNGRPDAGADPPSSPRLYQAQHPPLAYILALPIWRALKGAHPLEAIYAIRALNVLLVAAALVLFAAALTRLVPAFAPRVAILALVCLHPLFFQNAARVANDALSLAAGIAGVSLLLLADSRTLLVRGLLAAVCIAASIWSKQTGLTLIPALVAGLPLMGWAHGASAGRIVRATTLAAFVLLLLVAPLWLWNYREYGSIVTTQESIDLAARGPVLEALAAAATTLDWTSLIDTLFVPGRPWVGGWSFLPMNQALRTLYEWWWSLLLAAAALGGVMAGRHYLRGAGPGLPRPRTSAPEAAGLLVCAAAVACTALGMIHHALVGEAVFGRSNTNPWYFMTALPFLFVLVVRGMGALSARLVTAAAASLAVLFVAIDLHGTWVVMPGAYAVTTDAALQWSRLSTIHPEILSADLRWLFLATQLGVLALAAIGTVHACRNPAAG